MKLLLFIAFIFISIITNAQTFHFSKLISLVDGGGYESKGSFFTIVVTDSLITCKTFRKKSLHYIGDKLDKEFVIKKNENDIIEAMDKETLFIFYITITEKSFEIKRVIDWPESEEYYFSN
jgi:hypothetical protein